MTTGLKDSAFVITGGARLGGSVRISGAKNAALPLMAAALLTPDDVYLENVPRIDDVEVQAAVLRSLGAEVEWVDEHTLRIRAAHLTGHVAPAHLVQRLRGSFLVVGALLGRLGRAASCAPGGDVIGQRPIDVHLAGFDALGARVTFEDSIYHCEADCLRGSRVFMDYPSVSGTENLLMAAVLARGETTIVNAAQEPEVVELAAMLNAMGAEVTGAGTSVIRVRGVRRLYGARWRLIPDRIEAGTFAIAAALAGEEVTVEGCVPEHLFALTWKLAEAGAEVITGDDFIVVRGRRPLRAVNIQAVPYPGFATDLQSVMGVLLTQAEGISVIHERVYDNRLLYVYELRKMGADIEVSGQTALIRGRTPLFGAEVSALDIRSGAALVLAGLVARGSTLIRNVYHLDRGYEKFDIKLRQLGAVIERVD